MIVIYKITNKITGKSYIGVSKRVQKRFRQHIQDAKRKKYDTYFYKAIRKYGEDFFELEILESFEDEKLAYQKEIEYIRKLNTLAPIGYNSHEGGKGGSLNASKELREKLSNAKQNYVPWNKGVYKLSKVFKRISRNHRANEYELTFSNGDKILIKNLNLFCKQNNYNQGNLSSLMCGKLKKHKNIICVKPVYDKILRYSIFFPSSSQYN